MGFKNMKRDDHGHVIGNDETDGQKCQHQNGGGNIKYDKEAAKKFADQGFEVASEKETKEVFDDDYEEEFKSDKVKIGAKEMTKEEWKDWYHNLDDNNREMGKEFLLNHASEFDMSENELKAFLDGSQDEDNKPKFDINELNKRTMRSAEMSHKVENAKRNGQTPQQVLDSVAYDMDISPDSEEYKNLKQIVMRDTRLNKESGAYEYNKYNIGSNKLLSGDERKKMEALAEEFKKAGLDVELKDTYEDYGADMKITNLISGDTQVLDPKEWMDYMNGNKSAEETVKAVKEGEYSDVFDWREPQQAEENSDVSQGLDKLGINQGFGKRVSKNQFEEYVKLSDEDKQKLRKQGFLQNYHGYDIEEVDGKDEYRIWKLGK